MSLEPALRVAIVLFPASEVALALFRRARPGAAAIADRGSMRRLWLAVGVGVVLAVLGQTVRAARLPIGETACRGLALVVLLAGLGLRWAAILTLGRLFTVDVAIQPNHALVQSGLYRVVRHPSYTGLLLAFLGLGISFGNWLSLAGLLVPIALAVIGRMNTEERALAEALGPPYRTYCARTKRLVPGLY